MSERRRILILCTANAARSQMAEGLVNALFADAWEAHSAGSQPGDQVLPLATQAMAELGIDISLQAPKPVRAYWGQPFDIILTVCDNALKSCPAWLGAGRLVHRGFPDPAGATGSPEERLQAFRQVRDALHAYLCEILRES